MIRSRLRLLLLLLCTTARLAVGAAQQETAGPDVRLSQLDPPPYLFDTFSMEQGLPQTNVNCCVQTPDGYLWIGTEAGLTRYDGLRFVSFRKLTTPGLLDHSVNCLLPSRQGGLWVGCERGLVHHRLGQFALVGLEQVAITALAEEAGGTLWIGTSNGLWSYAQGRLLAHTDEPSLEFQPVKSLFVDEAQRLWIGLANRPGLVRHAAGAFSHYDDGGTLTGITNAMCQDTRRTLWFATTTGIFSLAPDDVRPTPRRNLATGAGMTAKHILATRDGGLWLVDQTLQRVADARHFLAVPMAGFPTRSAIALTIDAEGSLWASARGHGLIRARPNGCWHLPPLGRFAHEAIKTVAEDATGHLWFTVARTHLQRLAPDGQLRTFGPEEGYPNSYPMSVWADRDGSIWTSFARTLVRRRPDGRLEFFPSQRGVHAFLRDRSGRLWCGGEEQLAMRRTDQDDFEEVRHADGSTLRRVYVLAETPDGTIYAGTEPGRLLHWIEGAMITLKSETEPPLGALRALYADSQGLLWLGLKRTGLAVWADGRCYASDLLASAVMDHVSAIQEDGEGRLWLGTPGGVLWADREDLLASARTGRREPWTFSLGRSSQLQPAGVISGGDQSLSWRLRNGRFVFATRRGLLLVDPTQAPRPAPAPPVHLESVRIDGQESRLDTDLQLPAGTREIAFGFTAVSFLQPERIQFRYRLQGFDPDWVDGGHRRSAVYGRLPPGRYVFQVQAGNLPDAWGEKTGASRTLEQQPYYYQTRWFLALLVCAVVAAAWGWQRWAHRRLAVRIELLEQRQATERERRRIAKRLHDDLGASLTEIGFYAENARQRATDAAGARDLAALSERSRALAESLDAVVWSIDPSHDYLDRLVSYLAEFFPDFLRLRGVRARLDLDPEFPPLPLSPEERTHLFLAVKEATHNLVKHAKASEGWLRVHLEGRRLLVVIEDNGIGFDPGAPRHAEADGLANLRSRLEEIGGAFALTSSPGKGCTVRFTLDLTGRVDSVPPAPPP